MHQARFQSTNALVSSFYASSGIELQMKFFFRQIRATSTVIGIYYYVQSSMSLKVNNKITPRTI